MNGKLFRRLAPVALVLVGGVLATPASAQVNCNAAPHGQARANCYAREAQIWREQSRLQNDIARQQYQQHQQIGRALRHAPLIGRYAAPAWNAPRTIYNFRNRR
jgi:hypothetical protein